jgi:hypothetical protein
LLSFAQLELLQLVVQLRREVDIGSRRPCKHNSQYAF